MIISVNTAAGDHLSWCSKDLIGLNLLKIGDNMEDHRKGESHPHLSSWFTSKKSVAQQKRKKSPEVLRIYILAKERSTYSVATTSFTQLTTPDIDHHRNDSVMWAMAEASLDPMFEINEKGIIRMVNRAALRLFGYCREEFLGSNISMIVGGGHAANHDKYLKRYLETGITKVIGKKRELSARRSDGTEFPIELGVAEVDAIHGEGVYFAVLCTISQASKRRSE
jgi:PAS domain S-box-containing protein